MLQSSCIDAKPIGNLLSIFPQRKAEGENIDLSNIGKTIINSETIREVQDRAKRNKVYEFEYIRTIMHQSLREYGELQVEIAESQYIRQAEKINALRASVIGDTLASLAINAIKNGLLAYFKEEVKNEFCPLIEKWAISYKKIIDKISITLRTKKYTEYIKSEYIKKQNNIMKRYNIQDYVVALMPSLRDIVIQRLDMEACILDKLKHALENRNMRFLQRSTNPRQETWILDKLNSSQIPKEILSGVNIAQEAEYILEKGRINIENQNYAYEMLQRLIYRNLIIELILFNKIECESFKTMKEDRNLAETYREYSDDEIKEAIRDSIGLKLRDNQFTGALIMKWQQSSCPIEELPILINKSSSEAVENKILDTTLIKLSLQMPYVVMQEAYCEIGEIANPDEVKKIAKEIIKNKNQRIQEVLKEGSLELISDLKQEVYREIKEQIQLQGRDIELWICPLNVRDNMKRHTVEHIWEIALETLMRMLLEEQSDPNNQASMDLYNLTACINESILGYGNYTKRNLIEMIIEETGIQGWRQALYWLDNLSEGIETEEIDLRILRQELEKLLILGANNDGDETDDETLIPIRFVFEELRANFLV